MDEDPLEEVRRELLAHTDLADRLWFQAQLIPYELDLLPLEMKRGSRRGFPYP